MIVQGLVNGSTSVEVVPARGGLVTSFVVDGQPVLFLDEATLVDPSKNVRGGVPLLFPFAGKAPVGSSLPQHGFARKLPWSVLSSDASQLTCQLVSTAETLAQWPFAFDLRFTVSLFERRLRLEWAFHNTGNAPMPLHFGIHPYFIVGSKAAVRVEGTTGVAFDNRLGAEREVSEVDFSGDEVDLHFNSFGASGTTLHRGDGRRVRLTWSPQFKTLVVWTLPGQPFVCVEPWTSPARAPARQTVESGATERLMVEMSVEP